MSSQQVLQPQHACGLRLPTLRARYHPSSRFPPEYRQAGAVCGLDSPGLKQGNRRRRIKGITRKELDFEIAVPDFHSFGLPTDATDAQHIAEIIRFIVGRHPGFEIPDRGHSVDYMADAVRAVYEGLDDIPFA